MFCFYEGSIFARRHFCVAVFTCSVHIYIFLLIISLPFYQIALIADGCHSHCALLCVQCFDVTVPQSCMFASQCVLPESCIGKGKTSWCVWLSLTFPKLSSQHVLRGRRALSTVRMQVTERTALRGLSKRTVMCLISRENTRFPVNFFERFMCRINQKHNRIK